jgi:hypothetical protein
MEKKSRCRIEDDFGIVFPGHFEGQGPAQLAEQGPVDFEDAPGGRRDGSAHGDLRAIVESEENPAERKHRKVVGANALPCRMDGYSIGQ